METVLALYGRRRVGKTFLIKKFFKTKKCVFLCATGEKDAPMKNQIKHFTQQISDTFFNGAPLIPGKNWDETFELLTKAFNTVDKKTKIVLFFDEFPWMATQNAKLLQSLDRRVSDLVLQGEVTLFFVLGGVTLPFQHLKFCLTRQTHY